MNPESEDQNLAAAFEDAKDADLHAAPPFDQLLSRRRAYRPAPLAYVSGLAAAAAVVCLFALLPRATNQPADPPAVAGQIPFDQLSDTISRELHIASADLWRSPTDFLLDPYSETSNPFER